MPVDPSRTWPREFAFRIRHHFAIKFVGTTAWVWVFFIGYFHLLRHAVYPVTTMPLTPLDALIPLVPAAVVPYLSLWFYVGIAPGLQRSFRELLAYGFWSALLCAIGLAIFYRFPTQIPPFVFDRTGLPGFALLQGIDAPGNACPSMHVAIAFFTGIWIEVLFREMRMPGWARAVNVGWFVVIALSTVAIRQHVVIDVLGGALLGGAIAVPSLAWRPKAGRRQARTATTAMIGGSPAGTPSAAGTVQNGGAGTKESPEMKTGAGGTVVNRP
jgi:membrane-associated phospholipid phosphatase